MGAEQAVSIKPQAGGYEMISDRRSIPANRRRLAILAVSAATLMVFAGIGTYLLLRGPSEKAVSNAYLAAMARGDYEDAYRELSESSKRSLREPGGLRQTAIGAAFSNGIADSYELGSAREEAGKTVVEVRLKKGNTATSLVITLVREGGRWRVEI